MKTRLSWNGNNPSSVPGQSLPLPSGCPGYSPTTMTPVLQAPSFIQNIPMPDLKDTQTAYNHKDQNNDSTVQIIPFHT